MSKATKERPYREGDEDPTSRTPAAEAPATDAPVGSGEAPDDQEYETGILLLITKSGDLITVPAKDLPGLNLRRNATIGEMYRIGSDLVEQTAAFRITADLQRSTGAMFRQLEERMNAQLASLNAALGDVVEKLKSREA